MKQKYLLTFLLSICLLAKGYSQNCNSLGCAANYGSQTVDATVADAFADAGSCYATFPYKQAYWQFFYSPSGGNFTQTYTPTSAGDPLDLDYVVFDMGLAGPGSIACPVNSTAFTQAYCNTDFTAGTPTGPGVEAAVATIAGHFYAVVIFAWQGAQPVYTFDIGNPQIGGVDLNALNCPGVLPVKLSSFDARVNNCIVDLTWDAETEAGFKQYEVQHSKDGRTFTPIATILAGTGTADLIYSYQHSNPQPGNNYYRLKMIDADNRSELSKTIAMNINCGRSSILVYPNPVTDFLNISVTNSESTPTTAHLFDNNGKVIYSSKLISGTNTIDMTRYSKGVYLLRLKNDTETQNHKIIK